MNYSFISDCHFSPHNLWNGVLSQERLCLYLHQVFQSDDIGADQRVGRQDAPEAPAMDLCNRFPIFHVLDVDTRAHDIFEACPEALQRALDLVDNKFCLRGRVVTADDPVTVRRGSPRNRPKSGAVAPRLVNLGMIGFGKRKTEQLQIILTMLADAKARSNGNAAYGRLIDDIAAGDIGYVSFLAEGETNFLFNPCSSVFICLPNEISFAFISSGCVLIVLSLET
jgi:hypothetical protein